MNQNLNIMKAIKRVSLIILVVFALGACNEDPLGEGLDNVTQIEKLQGNSGSTLDDNIE